MYIYIYIYTYIYIYVCVCKNNAYIYPKLPRHVIDYPIFGVQIARVRERRASLKWHLLIIIKHCFFIKLAL